MLTPSLIISFIFLIFGILNAEIIKSETLTPRSSEANGIRLLTQIAEVSKKDNQEEWSIFVLYQNSWQFIFIMDETWGFHTEKESSISFTVNSPKMTTQTFDNIIFGFSTNNNEYISMSIPIGNINNNQINTNKIYPNCLTQMKSEFATGDIARLPYYNRQCDVANGNCDNWDNMKPENLQTFNTFPITVIFANNPNTNTMYLSFHSVTTNVQRCVFTNFPTNQGLKIYFAGNGNGQQFDISSFEFAYRTKEPIATPTDPPTKSPSSNPIPAPTANPILNPTLNPTLKPTVRPSFNPSFNPTQNPVLKPTFNPSSHPTFIPSSNPSHKPTFNPIMNPTLNPILKPTSNPTFNPIMNPTLNPILKPTSNPTLKPTSNPTLKPTSNPTLNPVSNPTLKPTSKPTSNPTLKPTTNPTLKPTFNPSSYPTVSPSSNPSHKPTFNPSFSPIPELAPLVPEWQNIYYDNMEINNGWFVYNQVTFGDSSNKCPHNDKCVRINGCADSRGGNSYIEKIIDITGYNSIRLKIDVTVDDIEPGDQCEVYYAFGSSVEKQLVWFSVNKMIYVDYVVDLPYPTNNYLKIKLKAKGESRRSPCADRCYYDNLYIQGLGVMN